MTTIFADLKSGVMVCDSKCTVGDTWIETNKVVRINDELIGFAGTATEGERWLNWYRSGKQGSSPKVNNSNALLMNSKGLWLLDSTGELFAIERGFMATGSGGSCATAAFMAGASPEKAVQIACQIDVDSGGKVVVHKLKGKK